MAINKKNIINFSNIILTSILGILTYIPYNKHLMVYITCYISFFKSFNIINTTIFEKIHHIVNAYLCLLLIYGNKLVDYEHIEQYNIIVRTNISTIFLILNYYYKNFYIKILFVSSFFYYRINYMYHVLKGMDGTKHICYEHTYVSENICNKSFYYSNVLLFCLNIYWGLIIIKKFTIMYKNQLYFIASNSSSILICLPLLFNSEYTYYEYSNIILSLTSYFYHIFLYESLRVIDSFFIINSCLSKYFSPIICILCSSIFYKSYKIKKIIYIITCLYTFYITTSLQNRLILLFSHILCYKSYNNYLQCNVWTIYNSWGWHLGNSIYLYIGGLTKCKKLL